MDPDRFLAGVALFKAPRSPSAVHGWTEPFNPKLPPEGRLYSRKPRISPRVRHDLHGPVNTAEEAEAVRTLLPRPLNRVLLVTSAYHMRRAQRLFERQGMEVMAFPVDFKARGSWAGGVWRDPLQWMPNAASLADSSVALRECLGRLVYRTW